MSTHLWALEQKRALCAHDLPDKVAVAARHAACICDTHDATTIGELCCDADMIMCGLLDLARRFAVFVDKIELRKQVCKCCRDVLELSKNITQGIDCMAEGNREQVCTCFDRQAVQETLIHNRAKDQPMSE